MSFSGLFANRIILCILCCIIWNKVVQKCCTSTLLKTNNHLLSTFCLYFWLPAVQPTSPSSLLLSNSGLHFTFSRSCRPSQSHVHFSSNIHLVFLFLCFLPASLIHYLQVFPPSPFIAMIISSPDKLTGFAWQLLCCLTHHDRECVCTGLSLYAGGVLSLRVLLKSVGDLWAHQHVKES